MSTEHTPTPWKVVKGASYRRRASDELFYDWRICDATGHHLVTIQGDQELAETVVREHNAHAGLVEALEATTATLEGLLKFGRDELKIAVGSNGILEIDKRTILARGALTAARPPKEEKTDGLE